MAENQSDAFQEQNLVRAPESYASYDADDEGTWAEVDPEGAVYIWTDWDQGAGVYWARQTPRAEYVYQQLQISKAMGITAGVAFNLILRSLGMEDSELREGKLSEFVNDFEEASKALGGAIK